MKIEKGWRWHKRKVRPYWPPDIKELYTCEPITGHWLWKGTVHKASGQPIWKGYKYARRVMFEMYFGPVKGQVKSICGKKLCVCPLHARVR